MNEPRATVPLVSVIIPGKDAARYLGDALRSAAEQLDDLDDLEVIFVNDGSRDDTRSVAERFSATFPRFTIVDNETAQGAYRARNQGLEIAQGRYISFLDADDWFAPGHLAVLARAMDELDCDFIRTDVIKAWGTKRQLRRAPQGRRGVCLDPRGGILPVDTYTMVDHPWSQAGMYHRRLIDRGLLMFPRGAATAEDRPWIWGLFLHADSYAVVDAPGFIWRKGIASSLTAAYDHKRLGFLTAFDRVRAMVEVDRDAESFMPKVLQSLLAITEHHLEHWDDFPPELQRGFVEGFQSLLAKFDTRLVEERFAAYSPDRIANLGPVLKGYRIGRGRR